MLQVSRIWAYRAKLHSRADGEAIAVAEGNELLPKLFQGGNNFAQMSQVLVCIRVVYGKLAPGEPRTLSLDSPEVGSCRKTATSSNSLNYEELERGMQLTTFGPEPATLGLRAKSEVLHGTCTNKRNLV